MLRRALALHALIGALVGLALLLWPLTRLQNAWLDLQLRHAAPQQPPAGVLVLDLDDASLRQLQADFGPWPFGRDVYALVVEALRDAGARAVVIDLVLADPRPGDTALARSIERPGAPVLLAAAGMPATPLMRGIRLNAPAPAGHQVWAQVVLPNPVLQAAGGAAGVITTPLDADGLLRRWTLHHAGPEGRWPLLPLAVLERLGEPLQLTPDARGRVLPLLGAEVATQSFARVALAARDGHLHDEALRSAKGQVVFIGASSLLADQQMTAVGQVSGTALLAQAYAALRDGRGLQALAPALQLGLLLLALVPAGLALLRGQGDPRRFVLEALAVFALLALLLALLAPHAQRWLDPSPMLATLLVTALLHTVWHLRQTQREAQRLERERERMEAASKAKSTFLANVSHELRTPLAAVLGLSELLAQGRLDEVQRRQVLLLQGAGRNLLNLIDELLDLSRIELDRLQLHAAPTRLAPLLQDSVALLQAQARARDLRCELVMGPDLPEWVSIDAQRLGQVLLNLMGNALKFTQRGSVELRVMRLEDGRVEFAVSDTGIGIAGSQLQRIFEPFLQAQGEGRVGGTGLGLAISRQLVRMMGGDIEVQSVPGSGSRFSFSLPLALSEPVPDAAEPEGVTLPPGLRLLLAEDDDVLAEVLQTQLAQAGLQVERAANGHLALALAKRMRFDLFLLDLYLPGLDGLRVVRELRAHEAQAELPRTPVLALSAHAHPEEARACLEAGCDAHLSKPISQKALLAALSRWAPESAPASGWGGAGGFAPAASPSAPEVPPRVAHAAVFLGRWGEAWAAARTDKGASEQLLRDLVDCAAAIGAEPLLEAARALQTLLAQPVPRLFHQSAAEQAVQREVEAALVGLR